MTDCRVADAPSRAQDATDAPVADWRGFHDALRRQAEGFARWVRGGPPEGASAADAVAALDAAGMAGR